MYRIIRYHYPRSVDLAPALAARNLWAGWESDVGQLFGSALADIAAPVAARRFPVDLYEDQANTYVRAELPGFARDAITVEMVDGYLNLTASRQEPGEEKDAKRVTNLSRSVQIPAEIQADKVTAAFENGVLTVTLPKREQAKPRKIAITIN